MKNMQRLVWSVALLFTLISTLLAQVPVTGGGGGGSTEVTETEVESAADEIPAVLPLQSFAVLKAYALTLVNQISCGVWADSISGDNDFVVDYPFRDANPDHMADVASAQTLKFTVVPSDELETYVNYVGHIGNDSYFLFWGWKQFWLTEKGASVPADAYEVELELSDWIPVRIPGLNYAYIELKNGDGSYAGYYNFGEDGRIRQEEGILYVGRKHLGQHGTLYVGLSDGTKLVYDTLSGARQNTSAVKMEGFKPSVKGVRTFPHVNPSSVDFLDGDELVLVNYTVAMNSGVTFMAGNTEYPIGVYVIDTEVLAENPQAEWQYFNPWKGKIEFSVTTGQSLFIRFEMTPKPESLDENGGGKG